MAAPEQAHRESNEGCRARRFFSPKDRLSTNIDLVCVGVEYLAAPRHMRGLDLVDATVDEIKTLRDLLGKDVQPSSVRVVVSEGHRFPIVAANFKISENQRDIFHSPFS